MGRILCEKLMVPKLVKNFPFLWKYDVPYSVL
jgi:hypothetical protein